MSEEEIALETVEIMLDEEQMSAIVQGIQEAERGLGRRWSDVRREMYGEWTTESVEDQALRQLAEEYHASCDAYDRCVCSGISPRTGEAMPVNPEEYGLINRHAREVRRDLMERANAQGLTEEQVSDAIRRYCKWR